MAVAFARWLSDDFGVWCDLQIDAIIRNAIRAEGGANLLPLLLRQEPGVWELRFAPTITVPWRASREPSTPATPAERLLCTER